MGGAVVEETMREDKEAAVEDGDGGGSNYKGEDKRKCVGGR